MDRSIMDAYGRLHLRPSAPGWLVKSVFKLLVRATHPDSDTPDVIRYDQYVKAYNVLKKVL